MALGRPITPMILNQRERTSLRIGRDGPKWAQALAQRARTILVYAEVFPNTEVAARVR